eukprot:1148122-Pelagomonas_calceolata.AAC.3
MAQLEHLCPCELYAQPGETTAPPLVELQKDVYVEEQDALLSHQKCWVKCRICLSLCVRKCTANAHALACTPRLKLLLSCLIMLPCQNLRGPPGKRAGGGIYWDGGALGKRAGGRIQ